MGATQRYLGRGRAWRLVSGAATLVVVACSHDAAAPPVATQLAFSTQPSIVTAGATMPAIQVEVRDASGNRFASGQYTITVMLIRNVFGRASLTGTTSQPAVNGVATFADLTMTAADTGYILRATAGALAAATSTPFAVTAAAPAQLAFTTQPVSAAMSQPLKPAVQVTIEDLYGNTVTTATNVVSVALGSNPSGGALSGTTMVTAANGVANFTTLAIDRVYTGYTLVATSGTLSGAVSAPFCVATINSGICYHGGAVIYAQKVAAIYWAASVLYSNGPQPGTVGSGTLDNSLVGYFLSNLGGSAYFNINTTYYDATNTHVQNVVTYTQYWAVGRNPSDTTDASIQAIVKTALDSGKLAYDSTTLYAVFTGPGANPGGGVGTQYCAYHFFFTYTPSRGSVRDVKYAVLPYAADFPTACVALRGSPNNDLPADAVVNVLAHETEETTTDGHGDAWYIDSNGYENGDLCAWQFGTTYLSNGAQANQHIGSKDFLIQMNWANAAQADGTPVGCAQHWP